MKRILIAAIAAGALYQAGVASAGCMATVGLAPPPQGIVPGTTWSAEITVLQHGVQPLPNAKTAQPMLTIVNAESGARQAFVAERTKDPAVYVAQVVFPAAGSWRYEVFDDFTSWGGEAVPCARTHSFAAVDVGGPAGGASATPPSAGDPAPVPGPSTADSIPASAVADDGSFPVWALVAGVLATLAAVVASLLVVRRRRGRGPEVAVR